MAKKRATNALPNNEVINLHPAKIIMPRYIRA